MTPTTSTPKAIAIAMAFSVLAEAGWAPDGAMPEEERKKVVNEIISAADQVYSEIIDEE